MTMKPINANDVGQRVVVLKGDQDRQDGIDCMEGRVVAISADGTLVRIRRREADTWYGRWWLRSLSQPYEVWVVEGAVRRALCVDPPRQVIGWYGRAELLKNGKANYATSYGEWRDMTIVAITEDEYAVKNE